MKDRLTNLIWELGIRAFRLTRKANLSTALEPIFIRMARFIPASVQPQSATLRDGSILSMPPGYRDTRTVIVGLFQEAESNLLNRLVLPGMTFVDIGAYVGYFTVLASRLVGANGHVYAFEPDALAFEYLTKNLAANKATNVTAFRKAVADRTAQAILVRDPVGPESYLAVQPAEDVSQVVDAVSLDSVFEDLKWPPVDIVKMNIEGSEYLALKGMRGVSQRNPNMQLVMEFNPSAMQRANVEPAELTQVLKQLGFRSGRVVERDLQSVDDQLVPKGGAVYNILLTK
jgi:FkbM family methyltransferase